MTTPLQNPSILPNQASQPAAPLTHVVEGEVPPPIQFGLCGPTSGGKTTFLIALSVAVTAAKRGGLGAWAMVDANPAAKMLIHDGQKRLIGERAFPEPTSVGTSVEWHIWGPRQARFLRSPKAISFSLQVDDLPGVAFLPNATSKQLPKDALDRLAHADALIFLIDPTRERDRLRGQESNWSYVGNLVRTLSSEYPGLLIDGLLPHHVAVCLTKFDEPTLFRDAFEDGWVDVPPGEQPRVPENRAKDFFQWVCQWVDRARGAGSTQALLEALGGSFIEDRLHYFATSSIGFWMPPGGDFDITDYQNYLQKDGGKEIRGAIRPINVLQPLIELESRIRRRR